MKNVHAQIFEGFSHIFYVLGTGSESLFLNRTDCVAKMSPAWETSNFSWLSIFKERQRTYFTHRYLRAKLDNSLPP